jgi:uncharacterized protein DUF6687
MGPQVSGAVAALRGAVPASAPTLADVGLRSPDLHYVPYGDLAAGTPNVVVDGSPAGGTLLCLSHWPGIGSPAAFAADLSAQMAFRYLDAFDHHAGAAVVSNNHFDQDGLVGVFALVAPDEALARGALLVEVARAGDFAVTPSRTAARISMVLSAYADPERSPLRALPDDDDARAALLYTELLGRLPALCDDPERFRDLWAEEDAALTASQAALASGDVVVTDVPDVDLAVIEVPETAPDGGGHRFGGMWVSGLHPLAVHGATERGALLTVRGHRYDLSYRYESWVQFRTRTVRPRVDLAPLADRLNEAEVDAGGVASWRAEPVSGLIPTLAPADGAESALAPAAVRAMVEAHLRLAPPAWDPYRVTR